MPSEIARMPYETHERLRSGAGSNRHLPIIGYEVAELPRRSASKAFLSIAGIAAVVGAALGMLFGLIVFVAYGLQH
jgi:hypothetical protein